MTIHEKKEFINFFMIKWQTVELNGEMRRSVNMKRGKILLLVLVSVLFTACGNDEVVTQTEEETIQVAEVIQADEIKPEIISESVAAVTRRYEEGLPVYDAWEEDLTELYELKENTPDLDFNGFRFEEYKINPTEAAGKSVAELTLELRDNMDNMRITYIGDEDSHVLWGQDEILAENVVDEELNSIEDIQSAMLAMVDREEQKEDYDGYMNGLIFLMNGETVEESDGCIEIHLQIRDGVIENKSVEFSGTMNNPVSYFFSAFIINETEAQIFDVECKDNPEIIKDHSRDNLYVLDYKVDVLEQYGIGLTINEIQWKDEIGNSDLRMRLTFVNNTKCDFLTQPRNDLVLDDKGERIYTFLTWSENIPAGETKIIDVNIKNVGKVISSIEMGFYAMVVLSADVETTVLKISDFTNGMPTISFDGQIKDVGKKYFEMVGEL